MVKIDRKKENIEHLPFSLVNEQLPNLEISFSASSTKTFSGSEKIIIHGNGEVEILSSVKINDLPTKLTGAIHSELIISLLQLLKTEGVEAWDENHLSKTRDFVSKQMTIKLKNQIIKQVTVQHANFPEFFRVYGAIKLIAVLANPKALKNGFFRLL